jgi:hypothetical protein
MPNLIGTGNNQVPTNGMLGGLAYQSPDNAVIRNLELTNLSGHNSLIPSNAVDVFVYDTRKDSDGGQWRKRTQHTSWYNETLNTATRGSRRDFPAVAILVLETGKLTIYDGDDPDMPMWMVFNTTDGSMLRSGVMTSIVMMNGEFWVGHDSGSGLHWVNFLKDTARWLTSSSSYGGFFKKGSIVFRNDAGANYDNNIGGASNIIIAASNIYDVAMTVLPNAPIDSATGLPIPTIAVATNGGVSVIRDDGTVINWLTTVGYVTQVSISKNYEIFAAGGDGIAYYAWYNKLIPTTSSNNSDAIFGTSYSSTSLPRLGSNGNSYVGGKNVFSNDTVYFSEYAGISTNNKLIILNQNTSHFGNSLVAYLTSSYNTGWMHGDIKGAWLSDTSTASVTGTELVTNGTFTTDTSGWTTNGSTLSISSNKLVVTITSAYGYAYQSVPTVIGKTYTLSFSYFRSAGQPNPWVYLGNVSHSAMVYGERLTDSSAEVSDQITFVATTTTAFIVLRVNGTTAGNFATFDNVSLRLAEPDRSVNNNGLAVYGTLTKSAVATDSNLVAYGGFSGSNYLQQPQNTALDFGTGDFSIMFWGVMVPLTGTYKAFEITYASAATNLFMDGLGLAITIGGNNKLYQNTSSNNIGWSHQTIVRRSGILYYYSNARLIASTTSTESLVTNSSSTLRIGEGFNQSLTLFRISASAPSPTQIAKIYNDEKVLFQPNSQCTLFGSSDAVTALAYDDTYQILSVGTSSGRSDFRGLERINNTTTAVTTAISASNGLIAEQ